MNFTSIKALKSSSLKCATIRKIEKQVSIMLGSSFKETTPFPVLFVTAYIPSSEKILPTAVIPQPGWRKTEVAAWTKYTETLPPGLSSRALLNVWVEWCYDCDLSIEFVNIWVSKYPFVKKTKAPAIKVARNRAVKPGASPAATTLLKLFVATAELRSNSYDHKACLKDTIKQAKEKYMDPENVYAGLGCGKNYYRISTIAAATRVCTDAGEQSMIIPVLLLIESAWNDMLDLADDLLGLRPKVTPESKDFPKNLDLAWIEGERQGQIALARLNKSTPKPKAKESNMAIQMRAPI